MPTPDPRKVVAAPRPRPALLVAACLLLAGLGVALFFVLAEEEATPPPARDLASALARARGADDPFAGLTEVELALGADCLRLAVADTEAERGQGLRGVRELGPYDGMLFVNASDATSAYTMSGVTVPLDIAWFSRTGEPAGRAEMEPCPEGGPDCPLYSADGPYRFAVETLAGGLPSGALGSCPS